MDVSLNPLQALSITGKSLRALNTHKILKVSLSISQQPVTLT